MIRRRVEVTGRVQGVFFRDGLREEAERRRVAGWVRNRDDGGLEAELEGEEDAVAAVLEFCRAGPPRAEVASCEVSELTATGEGGFTVR